MSTYWVTWTLFSPFTSRDCFGLYQGRQRSLRMVAMCCCMKASNIIERNEESQAKQEENQRKVSFGHVYMWAISGCFNWQEEQVETVEVTELQIKAILSGCVKLKSIVRIWWWNLKRREADGDLAVIPDWWIQIIFFFRIILLLYLTRFAVHAQWLLSWWAYSLLMECGKVIAKGQKKKDRCH